MKVENAFEFVSAVRNESNFVSKSFSYRNCLPLIIHVTRQRESIIELRAETE